MVRNEVQDSLRPIGLSLLSLRSKQRLLLQSKPIKNRRFFKAEASIYPSGKSRAGEANKGC